MQRTCVLWLSCTVVIYFFSTVTTVYGRKCSGRWAIHACYGGNGKRSGPPSDSSDTLDRSKPFILGQLLLKNRSLMPELLSNYADDPTDLIDQDTVYPDNDDVVREEILERQQILERVNSILSDMLLTRRLQDRKVDREPYY